MNRFLLFAMHGARQVAASYSPTCNLSRNIYKISRQLESEILIIHAGANVRHCRSQTLHSRLTYHFNVASCEKKLQRVTGRLDLAIGPFRPQSMPPRRLVANFFVAVFIPCFNNRPGCH